MMYVKVKIELKCLIKLILSNVHLKIIGAYAIKCFAIRIYKDILAFHASFIRVLRSKLLILFNPPQNGRPNYGGLS